MLHSYSPSKFYVIVLDFLQKFTLDISSDFFMTHIKKILKYC